MLNVNVGLKLPVSLVEKIYPGKGPTVTFEPFRYEPIKVKNLEVLVLFTQTVSNFVMVEVNKPGCVKSWVLLDIKFEKAIPESLRVPSELCSAESAKSIPPSPLYHIAYLIPVLW